MVSFPDEFLAEVDRIASEEKRSRSELLREAMRLYIEVRRGKKRPGDSPQVQRAIAIQNALAKVASGTDQDGTRDVRYWRENRAAE